MTAQAAALWSTRGRGGPAGLTPGGEKGVTSIHNEWQLFVGYLSSLHFNVLYVRTVNCEALLSNVGCQGLLMGLDLSRPLGRINPKLNMGYISLSVELHFDVF